MRIMFRVTHCVNVMPQSFNLTIDKDFINERSDEFSILFSFVKIGYFSWSVNHGMT